ncbi:hypothetical protein N665_0906s0006 [Sinapis alba]|nr:hypothetical protein N665_0906s0006 [Sinapis alba]
MTKYVSVHFKFKCRIYSVTTKTTLEDITLAMLEERLYKKLSICDDEDLFVYLTSIDKENHRSFLLVEEMSKLDELEKLSRGSDEAIGPKAITLYVENREANQQKELIEAENDEDTTEDDVMDT